MATLRYWVAPHLTDSAAFNIRAKTKRRALEMVEDYGPGKYGPVEQVAVEYDGAFDLLEECLGESSGYWEP